MIDNNPFPRPDASNVQSVEAVLYFVWERECVRIAKENGHDSPWTEDPVLQKYRFTNIRRRDDLVSRWMLDNYYPHFRNGDDVWFAAAVARLINWPPTLKYLIGKNVIPRLAEDFDPISFVRTLDSAPLVGGKIYGAAYMLYPGHEPGRKKSNFVADVVLTQLVEKVNRLRFTATIKSVAEMVKELTDVYGLSTFMAGQIAADLTYLSGQLDKAKDLYTYAPIGPGSQRGLNYLFHKPPNHAWEQEDFNTALQNINKRIKSDLGITDLTLHDVQSIAGCEFSKYCRAVLNEGKPRVIYKPETNF